MRGTLEAGRAPEGGFRLRLTVPLAQRMIRVLIAEDQAMVRGALASLLALEDDIEVVAEVERGDDVLEAATRDAARTSRCSTSRCRAWTASRPPRELARELPADARR